MSFVYRFSALGCQTNMSLETFPDLCLLGIFRHLSIFDLFRYVHPVCQRWKQLASVALNRRHTLLVVGDDYELDLYRNDYIWREYHTSLIKHVRAPNRLISNILLNNNSAIAASENIVLSRLMHGRQVGRLTEPITNSLMHVVKQLKKLYKLSLVHSDFNPESFRQLIRLLVECKNSPVSSLELYLTLTYQMDTVHHPAEHLHHQAHIIALFGTLFDTLSRMETLKHLTLHLSTGQRIIPFMNTRTKGSIHELALTKLAPIVSRLDTFNFLLADCSVPLLLRVQESTEDMFILWPLTRSNQKVKIIPDDSFRSTELALFTEEFARQFVRLSLHESLDALNYRSILNNCLRFRSLKSLTLNVASKMRLCSITSQLTVLTELIHLKLWFDDKLKPTEPSDCVPLPSVLLLDLKLTTSTHEDTSHIPQFFPSLQVIALWHQSFSCATCGYGDEWDLFCNTDNEDEPEAVDPEMTRRMANCMRLARLVFKRCPKLHTIEYNDSPDEEINRKLLSNIALL